MDFRIAHRFPCVPAKYWAMTHDPVYEQSFRGDDVDTVVLEARDDGTHSFERRRVSPRKLLPPLMAKAIGRDRLSYVQEVDFDNAACSSVWRVVSDIMPDKVRCAGTSKILAVEGGCERVMQGRIDVEIFLVGGQIEKHILKELQGGYDRAAEIMVRLLAERNS